MKTKKILPILVLFFSLLLVACSPGVVTTPAPVPPPATEPISGADFPPTAVPDPPATSPSEESPTNGSQVSAPHVKLALADLVDRLAVSQEAIQVGLVEEVTWPDTGLGCPQPGMAYAQVLTPGYRIHLELDGNTYTYHADEGKKAIFCEEGSMVDQSTEPGVIEPGLDNLVALAKEDLAGRLATQVALIQVLEARSVVWRDSSLGCPLPGMMYLQVLRDGTMIRLMAGDRVYQYHSGGGRAPFLCENPSQILPDPGGAQVPPPGQGNE